MSAIEVAIEVKHGFKGHRPNIISDIQKLSILKEGNPKCEVIMLVVTSDNTEKVLQSRNEVREVADKLKVNLIYE